MSDLIFYKFEEPIVFYCQKMFLYPKETGVFAILFGKILKNVEDRNFTSRDFQRYGIWLPKQLREVDWNDEVPRIIEYEGKITKTNSIGIEYSQHQFNITEDTV